MIFQQEKWGKNEKKRNCKNKKKKIKKLRRKKKCIVIKYKPVYLLLY